MPLINPLKRLAPNGYAVPPPITDYPDPNANSPLGNQPQVSPLVSLAGAQDATGTDGPILQQYKRLLANPPQQQPISTGRRILGALAGLGAGASPTGMTSSGPVGFRYDPKAQELAQSQVTDAPYDKQLKQYDLAAKTLSEGANIEEKQVTNQRLGDVAKANEELKNKQLGINQQNADIKQQQEQIAAKKEQDIFDTKQKELQAKADKAEKDLVEKQKEFEGRQANVQQQLDLHKLQIQVVDAQHQLQIAQKDRALDEAKRQHDAEKARWDSDREVQLKKVKDLEDAAKAKEHPPDKEVVKTDVPVPSIWQKLIGQKPEGKTTITKTTTSGYQNSQPNNKQQAPPMEQRVVGQTKFTLPNGKVGIWNGTGWVVQ